MTTETECLQTTQRPYSDPGVKGLQLQLRRPLHGFDLILVRRPFEGRRLMPRWGGRCPHLGTFVAFVA